MGFTDSYCPCEKCSHTGFSQVFSSHRVTRSLHDLQSISLTGQLLAGDNTNSLYECRQSGCITLTVCQSGMAVESPQSNDKLLEVSLSAH